MDNTLKVAVINIHTTDLKLYFIVCSTHILQTVLAIQDFSKHRLNHRFVRQINVLHFRKISFLFVCVPWQMILK